MANVISPLNFNKVVDMTDAISLVQNKYQRLGELGLFPLKPVAQRSFIYDRKKTTWGMLADTKGLGNKQLGSKSDTWETFSLMAPEFNYSDMITTEDFVGLRGFDSVDQKTFNAVREEKLTRLRSRHEITHEFLRFSALKGITTTPDGKVYANMYTEFNVTPYVKNFDFTNADLDINGICRDILRHMEDETLMGNWQGMAHIFVDAKFFDALTSHQKVYDAYNQYLNANQLANAQVNRDDLGRMQWGRRFVHCGILFEEHRGKASYNGSVVPFIAVGEGHGYPMGMTDLFSTFVVPALHKFSVVGSTAQETYAWQRAMENDEQIEIESYSSVLPVCHNPAALVRVTGTYA